MAVINCIEFRHVFSIYLISMRKVDTTSFFSFPKKKHKQKQKTKKRKKKEKKKERGEKMK